MKEKSEAPYSTLPVTMKSRKRVDTITLENGQYLLRVNICLSCNPAILLLSRYPKKRVLMFQEDLQNVK